MDPNSYQSSGGHGAGHPKKHPPSSSELMASAKLVAEAAKSGFGHESVDKGKVAGAAADLLDAASHYGKLEDKAFGKYVDKAETYLHQYHTSHSTTTTTTTTTHPGHHNSPDTTTTTTTTDTSSHSGGDASGGYGDYMKMAQGLMNSSGNTNTNTTKPGSGSHEGSGGGYGEYFKMAEGFLKKH